MNSVTVKRVTHHVSIKRGEPTAIRVVTRNNNTVSVKPTGLRGPQGERGEQGPPGPIGNLDNLDLPDFTLIFENQLV